ncbi:MAG: hypothetical protein NVS3B26_30720 [Mycobacteriales bacterium]
MREQYVHPPLVPREPTPLWVAVWRFRITALALLILLLIGAYVGFEHFSGAASQDPGLSSLPAFR